MHATLGMTAGAVGAEFPGAELVQDRFGDHRTRRITGAKKKHVVGAIGHDSLTPASACAACGAQQHFSWAMRGARSPLPSPQSVLSPVVRKVSRQCRTDRRSRIFPTWRSSSWSALL